MAQNPSTADAEAGDRVRNPYASEPSLHGSLPGAADANNNHCRDRTQRDGKGNNGGAGNSFLSACQRAVYSVIPPGGIMAGAFNMASVSIGAGFLGLPQATEASGLVLSMILLALIAFYSIYSMYILAITAQHTRIQSFEGMARWLFPYGHYAFSYWAAFVRWFHAFSAGVAYVISVGNCFSPIFDRAAKNHPDNAAIKYFNTQNGNRLISFLIWAFFMFPLVVPKHVDSLRIVSMITVLWIVFFCIMVIIHSVMNGFKENRHKIVLNDKNFNTDDPASIYLFRSGNPVVVSVGVFMFAFVCQINALEIYWDMRPEIRTTANYTWSATIGMLLVGALYMLVAAFGYLDFGSKEIHGKQLLLKYDPLKEPAFMVAYMGAMTKLCVAYALQTNAARNSLYYVIGWQAKYSESAMRDKRKAKNEPAVADGINVRENSDVTDAKLSLENTEVCNDIDKSGKATVAVQEDALAMLSDDTAYIDNVPFLRHLIAIVILAGIELLLGLFIPNINTVFGFAGSISGGFMAFILPALFYMYSGIFSLKECGWFDYLCTYSLLLCGVIGVIWGTIGTIYDVALQ